RHAGVGAGADPRPDQRDRALPDAVAGWPHDGRPGARAARVRRLPAARRHRRAAAATGGRVTMKLSDAFPSTFLKAADLNGQRAVVIVSHVKFEDIGGDHKPLVYFKGKDKGLVLNKTNGNMIAEISGDDDTDNWG